MKSCKKSSKINVNVPVGREEKESEIINKMLNNLVNESMDLLELTQVRLFPIQRPIIVETESAYTSDGIVTELFVKYADSIRKIRNNIQLIEKHLNNIEV